MNRICLKTSKLKYNSDHLESTRLDLKEPKQPVLGTRPGEPVTLGPLHDGDHVINFR